MYIIDIAQAQHTHARTWRKGRCGNKSEVKKLIRHQKIQKIDGRCTSTIRRSAIDNRCYVEMYQSLREYIRCVHSDVQHDYVLDFEKGVLYIGVHTPNVHHRAQSKCLYNFENDPKKMYISDQAQEVYI